LKKRLFISVSAALVVSVLISITGFAQTCANLRGEVLRLHILAHSDSDEDQALKLKVRDRLLSESIFTESENKEEALKKALESLDLITETAKDEIVKNGYDYDVKVEITEMRFTTREYDTFTLPAGRYEAVRVLIGEGNGKNWWCVMFPPLCVPAATDKKKPDDVFTSKESQLMTEKPKYKMKFKIIEIFEGIRSRFSK